MPDLPARGSPLSGANRKTYTHSELFRVCQRLRELGWIEGRTVAIEYRWAEGRADRWGEIATEFARLKVDIVVTAGVAAVNAAKQAMPTTPIVFPLANDPVSAGVVASLARPGGNLTGLATLLPDTVGKRLELLSEIIPALRRLAASGGAQMMLVLSSPFFLPHRARIVELANTHRMPSMFIVKHWAQAGGLMS